RWQAAGLRQHRQDGETLGHRHRPGKTELDRREQRGAVPGIWARGKHPGCRHREPDRASVASGSESVTLFYLKSPGSSLRQFRIRSGLADARTSRSSEPVGTTHTFTPAPRAVSMSTTMSPT